MKIVHTPVLADHVLNYLEPVKKDSLFIDGTMGEGGHSSLILEKWKTVQLIGLDADKNIQDKAKKRLAFYGNRVSFRHVWFDDYFSSYGEERDPDRILLDLGISMYHYDESGRGFSFRVHEPLDMRLDPATKSAADIVNNYSEEDLANIIYKYGEERYSRRIAKAIVLRREDEAFQYCDDLAAVIKDSVPKAYQRGRISPSTKTFQALRIVVNSELERLDKVMKDAFDVLAVGGRLGIITFHSLEDRAVKNYFRDLATICLCGPDVFQCTCGDTRRGKLITRKAVGPTEEEVASNSASRSAKLRVIEKNDIGEEL